MADRPILFSAPMVRALLAGTKTQTRRVIKPQPELMPSGNWHVRNLGAGVFGVETADVPSRQLDYLRIEVGDRLWVRERFAVLPRTAYALPKAQSPDPDMAAYYFADFDRSGKPAWKPSIHMPRWASRITLTVIDVRVQRLQEVSEGDALAEGCKAIREFCYVFDSTAYGRSGLCHSSPVIAYSILWDEINGPGSWDANPWVAAYTFTVQLGNIDQVAA